MSLSSSHEIKRRRLHATFLDLPQDVRLAILDFCTFQDIRKNVLHVSKECWLDCWRLQRTPTKVCFTFDETTELINLFSLLDSRRSLYQGKLGTLEIECGNQLGDFEALSRCLQSTTFWFQHLKVKAYGYQSEWSMGTVVHLLCKVSLPSLREISLSWCSFTKVEFCSITKNTPLVEKFTGYQISVEKVITGEEFGNWSNLKVLRLKSPSCCRMILPLLSSVAHHLEEVDVAGLSFTSTCKRKHYRHWEKEAQEALFQFGLSAPKLMKFTSDLLMKNQERLQLERPTMTMTYRG